MSEAQHQTTHTHTHTHTHNSSFPSDIDSVTLIFLSEDLTCAQSSKPSLSHEFLGDVADRPLSVN